MDSASSDATERMVSFGHNFWFSSIGIVSVTMNWSMAELAILSRAAPENVYKNVYKNEYKNEYILIYISRV